MENRTDIYKSSGQELTLDEQLIKALDNTHLSGPDDLLNPIEGGTGDAVATNRGKLEKMNALNPLMIDLILNKLTSFLSMNQLREVRLVNRYWNTHAIQYLRVCHHSIEFEDDEDLSDFKKVMESTIQFPFGDFDFDDFGKQQKDFLNKFGNHILELSIWSKKFSIHQLQDVFSTCRNLEYFSMRTTPFLTPEADILFELEKIEMTNLKTLVFRGESDLGTKIYNQRLVYHVFELIPNVKSVRFDCSKEFVPKVFQAMKISPLKFLHKLDVQVGVSEDDIKMLSECSGVALKTLKLGHVRINSEHESFKTFLATQPSLVELWIYTISYPKNEGGNEPPPFSFPTMPNLKRLFMDEVYQKDDDPQLVAIADIDLPTMFPKLEKLEVLEEAFCKHLKASQPTQKVESLSVTNAETETFRLQDFSHIRDMFPNLQRLNLAFVTSRWLTEGVFKYLTNLTHLTLEESALKCLDSVLTGICRSITHTCNFAAQGESVLTEESIQRYLSHKDRPSLSAMSNLRSLKIEQSDRDDENDDEDEVDDQEEENSKLCQMTDASVYLALLLIKPLDILAINESSVEFSDRALSDLKAHHKLFRFC